MEDAVEVMRPVNKILTGYRFCTGPSRMAKVYEESSLGGKKS